MRKLIFCAIVLYITSAEQAWTSVVPEVCKLVADKDVSGMPIVSERLRLDIDNCLKLFAIKTALPPGAEQIRDQEIMPNLLEAKKVCAGIEGPDPMRTCFKPIFKARAALVNYFAKLNPNKDIVARERMKTTLAVPAKKIQLGKNREKTVAKTPVKEDVNK